MKGDESWTLLTAKKKKKKKKVEGEGRNGYHSLPARAAAVAKFPETDAGLTLQGFFLTSVSGVNACTR